MAEKIMKTRIIHKHDTEEDSNEATISDYQDALGEFGVKL